MSVLDSFGGGNVWSLGELEFTSSINDILEKENFTLDELLREPELLQEVKSKNEKLIEFLSADSVITELLTYISVDASNDDDDYRKYKYPYMSCEIICFEIPSVLDKIVDTQDERYLKLLFDPILQNRKLNNYLAGYFEKMLEVLFRCKTVSMMRYMNEGGLSLLNKFLAHIDNYSIMQIIQRLLLPHIPFYSDALNEEINDEDRMKLQCLWSYDINTSKYLIGTMINANKYEISMHVADLLITVIQLSPSDAPILKYLSDSTICQSLCQVIENSVNESTIQLFSLEVAVASVLECLLSRIHETVLSIFLNSNPAYNEKRTKDQIDGDQNLYLNLKDCIQNILKNISIILPKIADSIYLEIDENSLKIVNQTKQPNKTLRQRTFYYTKLIESLCRLGDSYIDDGLVISGIVHSIVKLFLLHPYHSMFHLSVQRIAVAILDDFMNRKNISTHLLVECDFFKIIQSELTIAIDIPISSRKPYIGHLLILALVLDNLIGTTTPYKLDIDVESLETTEKVNEPTAKSSFREYFEDILDLQTWDTFSVEVLNKLSVAATQSINTEILDSPVLELGANSRFLKQSDSLELGFDAFDEGNDNDWNDELNYPYGNSTNVYTNTNNSHYDDLKEFKKDFAKPNMFETDWNANFHDTSIDDFATFASFPAQSGTATFPDPCGTETFPASRYEAPGVQINKDNKVIDFDDPFSYSNDDLKIDDLVNEDK